MGSSYGKLCPPSRESAKRKYQSDLYFFQHSTKDGFFIWQSTKRSSTQYSYREKNLLAVSILQLRLSALIQLKEKRKFSKTPFQRNELLKISFNGFTQRLPQNSSLAIFYALAALEQERYIFGLDPGSLMLNCNEVLDRENMRWSALPNFNENRRMHGVCSFEPSLVYIFCGFSQGEGKVESIECLDNEVRERGWQFVTLLTNNCEVPRINIQLQYNSSQLFIAGTWNEMKSFLVEVGPQNELEVVDEHESQRLHNRERFWTVVGSKLFYVDYDEQNPPIFYKEHFEENFSCFYMREKIYYSSVPLRF